MNRVVSSLVVTVVGLAALFVLNPSVSAQNKTRLIAEAQAPGWEKVRTSAPANETSADRWVKFENEYGTYKESPSRVRRMLQATKYGIDTVTFTAQEAAKRLEFRYTFGERSQTSPGSITAKPEYSLPLFGSFGHAQLKSIVAQHDPQTGTAFVGLKLSILFGRGG